MAGVVRTSAYGLSGSANRLRFGKGVVMIDKSATEMIDHVQVLRGEKKSFELHEDEPKPVVEQAVVEQQKAQAPEPSRAVIEPTRQTLTAQLPSQPYVPPLSPFPPYNPPPIVGLPTDQVMHLTAIGLPLTPQQSQWLAMGYPYLQVLSPQQMAALGLASPQMMQPPQMMNPMMQQPQMMQQMPQQKTAPQASLYQQFENQISQVKVGSFDYIDQKKTSIKFGFIGTGQGGSRIAEAFYHLGYPTCVINTSVHDLQNINIPEDNKLLLKIGAGGAGKDLQEGLDAARDYAEDILDLMKNTFPRDIEHIIVCCGGGGGSGSGSLPKVVDMARIMNVPVGVVYTIPKDSEGSKVKENAFSRLMMLDKKLAASEMSPLIIIDNNKIHEMHIGVSLAKFWRIANAQIAGLFHLFNVLSAQNSPYTSFDPADYKTIINAKGCLLFGSTVVEDSSRKTAVSKALRENIAKGLLVEGFDLTASKIAGMIITGSQELMENLPQENVDEAVSCLSRIVGNGTLHHGVYVENVDKLTVYTLIGGLILPEDRVNKLMKS